MQDLPPLIPFLLDHLQEALIFLVFIGWPILQSILASSKKKEERERARSAQRSSRAPTERKTEEPVADPTDLAAGVPSWDQSADGKWRDLVAGRLDEEAPRDASVDVLEAAPAPPSVSRIPPPTSLVDHLSGAEASPEPAPDEAADLGDLPAPSFGELPELEAGLTPAAAAGDRYSGLTEIFVDLPSGVRGAPDAPLLPRPPAPGRHRGGGFTPPRDFDEWRRAVVLAEVLGPPLSEREPGVGTAPGLAS